QLSNDDLFGSETVDYKLENQANAVQASVGSVGNVAGVGVSNDEGIGEAANSIGVVNQNGNNGDFQVANIMSDDVAVDAVAGKSPTSKERRFSYLHDELKSLQNEHTVFGWHSINNTGDTLNTIDKYDDAITKASSEIGIPKEVIQAVLFREITFYSPADVTDVTRTKTLWGLGQTHTASIGLGQIFPKTAIDAEKALNDKMKVKNYREYTHDEMFERLQDPELNIYYTAIVLAHKADLLGDLELGTGNRDNIEKVLARYNGFGDTAAKYGRETYQYYEAFKKYNY
ncbi:hypothetical protein LJC10_06325, partial [Selenomonadales bacterium OttesenSCG-928-I06]|nr:hypothetical protein [Selenomonadales bacterium OttesenSCG-928-I06]